MSGNLITFAVITPDGDLYGSTLNESIKEAWDEVEDLAWNNRKWEKLETEGYKLIELTWENTEERLVKTRDYL